MEKKFLLNDNWEFSLANVNEKFDPVFKIKKGKWLKASVPGTIHTDLLQNKIIPDPFFADYEKYLQWIGLQDWSYRTHFDIPEIFNPSLPFILQLKGLDTVAEIFLNDEKIGKSNNMFRELELNISSLVKNKNNKLEIIFRSPVLYAKEEEAKHGKLPVALNSERVYIRKAQYSFGWDWGPSFATSGIWKDITLIQPETSYIKNFTFNTLEVKEHSAIVQVKTELFNTSSDNMKIIIQLFDVERLIYEDEFPLPEKNSSFNFEIKSPELWYPNGYGEPYLYNIKIRLYEGSHLTDIKEARVGIRKIELQLKDGEKDTFRFIVNGKPVFARGVNWIPADSFIPRIDEDKYRTLLKLAAEGHMNIVRVWGGGFYENDIFYDLCDELGLLVWQDFMFACASYPTHQEFIDNIAAEFDYNIKRIRNHTSLAIWCGNNENEWIWFNEQKKSYKEMPGYYIYSQVIPSMLQELDPLRPYWQSSPFSNEEDPNSPLSGNRHQWQLWSMWTDYNKVFDDESLFVTEFGFQGPANKCTLEKVIPHRSRTVQNELFEFHNKQVEGNDRVFRFLAGHLPVRTDWNSFIYLAQLNQGLALSTCLYHWRSREPETNGSIIWQLNDCWPVTSWSLIDSDMLPKLSYHLVKNMFNQQIVVYKKLDNKNKNSVVSVSIKNSAHESFHGTVEVKLLKFPEGKIKSLKKVKVKTSANSEEALYSAEFNPENSFIIVSVTDEKKKLVHRSVYKEKEWKHIRLPKTKVKYSFNTKRNILKVKASEPAFYVYLHKEGTIFHGNGLILLPGEEEHLRPEMVNGRSKFSIKELNVNTLNDYLH